MIPYLNSWMIICLGLATFINYYNIQKHLKEHNIRGDKNG